MHDELEITPVSGPIRATVRPPGSKSLTNRVLVCAALAEGESTLRGALASEDTRVMIDALRLLGIQIEPDDEETTLRVVGHAGRIAGGEHELWVENSGTTVRFLTALTTLGEGTYRLDGSPRMRERPIGPLLDALNSLGADARSELGSGCPPVVIRGRGLIGGTCRAQGDVSSQFLSGLLLAAPYAQKQVEIDIDGPLVSRPYVAMTNAVMRSFGVHVEASDSFDRFVVPSGQKYRAIDYRIEPDASAASYFFAAAAITGGEVTVEELSRDSLQGDVAFCDCLVRMGCEVDYGPTSITVRGRPLKGVDADMNAISDTAQTLAAVALFAQGTTTIRGVAHIRHKETDRIGNLAAELRRLGASVRETPDGLAIMPGELRGASVETYEDHRMAMSLALVGLKILGVRIANPACVAKTYPNFFDDLESLRHSVPK